MENPAPEENQLNIELSEEMAEGAYVNFAMIAHSSHEFVMDFIRILPGIPKAKVKSRVVMTPEHAQHLMRALQENLARFEESFGAIDRGTEGFNFPFPNNYNGPIGEA
jgi:hypothetical protein